MDRMTDEQPLALMPGVRAGPRKVHGLSVTNIDAPPPKFLLVVYAYLHMVLWIAFSNLTVPVTLNWGIYNQTGRESYQGNPSP